MITKHKLQTHSRFHYCLNPPTRPLRTNTDRWRVIHLQVAWALCFTPTFNHSSPFTHLPIKGQISAIKATMCTIFYQPQRYCGISILINFSLWGMSVVVGVALRVLTNAFLHICELHKYAHIVAHLHVPRACKGEYRQDAVQSLISPSLVAQRVWSCRMVRMHRLSVMIFLLPLRFPQEPGKIEIWRVLL